MATSLPLYTLCDLVPSVYPDGQTQRHEGSLGQHFSSEPWPNSLLETGRLSPLPYQAQVQWTSLPQQEGWAFFPNSVPTKLHWTQMATETAFCCHDHPFPFLLCLLSNRANQSLPDQLRGTNAADGLLIITSWTTWASCCRVKGRFMWTEAGNFNLGEEWEPGLEVGTKGLIHTHHLCCPASYTISTKLPVIFPKKFYVPCL
jgi:hypothetical protein